MRPERALLLCLCWLACLLPLRAQSTVHAAGPEPVPTPEWNGELDLQSRLKDVRTEGTGDSLKLIVRGPAGDVAYQPQAFAELLQRAQDHLEHSGLLYRLFNITTPWGILWVGVGFLGQALFTFRMLLQWWASEKHKRSIVPVAFWWGSLFGGLMLFVYFIWRKDIVGIIGQSTGVFVYARNLLLIYRNPQPA
jgi:lipid-A-disaccharide synthase-like uncharacterized protein